MIVINLFAGPGAGKSTTAAGLFYAMKKKDYSVELVTEYAKEKVWEGSQEVLADQVFLIANQNRRLERLRGKVEWVVTDSPLLLGKYYGQHFGIHPEIEGRLAVDLFNTYNNVNIFIERTKAYRKLGRLGGEEKAKQHDVNIRSMLDSSGVHYITHKDTANIVQEIMEQWG